MNVFSALNYPSNTAVTEYQAALQAQKAHDTAVGLTTPEGQVATYDLHDRVPDWSKLLHIEKPHLYSAESLRTALTMLANPEALPNASPQRVAEQFDAFTAALAAKV
jgi:hypothetical protein